METDTVAGWIREAASLAVLTGAGVSAESGVPTFRGADGLWKQFRAEELATLSAFSRNPGLVWEWYDWRRGLIAATEPNAAHQALARLEGRKDRFLLITQNVDGLHDRAGSCNLAKLHGDLWVVRCLECGLEMVDRRVPLPALPPQCECGGLLRPGVVWFGETLPREPWIAAHQAVTSCDLLLVVGTSAQVYPAAGLITEANRAGARVVEINLETTRMSSTVDLSLKGKCGEILKELIE